MADTPLLRVALVVGTLGRGGAEKQLVYLTRALQEHGVKVRIYCLTRGEFFEPVLQAMGAPPRWIGQQDHPLARLSALTAAMLRYRPHVVQATHFHANLYVTGAARVCGAIGIGASRNEPRYEIRNCGRWGKWMLQLPPSLVTNSHAAKRSAEELGIPPSRIHVLLNTLDFADFETRMAQSVAPLAAPRQTVAVAVGRLVTQKRFEIFIEALHRARSQGAALHGVLVGEGPERPALEEQARGLGLGTAGLTFLGVRDDVPAILRRAGMFVLSSEHEGFPNVVLEAMAAGLPVITTPAGDADRIVAEGVTGYVVPFRDVAQMTERMVRLTGSPELRRQLGAAGRQQAEQLYGVDGLAARMVATYGQIAGGQHNRRTLAALRALEGARPAPRPKEVRGHA